MKKSKAILMVVCAMLLVAASVMGTLAYLTSQDSVTNTFSVGKVAITMDEADVDEYGYLILDDEQIPVDRVDNNTYKLMPGHTYTKDPIVYVDAASEDCYLFVKVVNEITAIEAEGDTVAAQMAAKDWTLIDADNGIYVYGKATAPTKVAARATIPVFDTFTVADTVDNATLANYAGKTIVVTAYAIQADGFESMNAADIWAEIPKA